MNYAAHYDRLISRARTRVLLGYRERHHVLPRCMGGSDAPENIVALTAEEHYVAHQLLIKMHPSSVGLATAAARMSKRCTGNKSFGWLRRRNAAAVSKLNRGREMSAEFRANVSARKRGVKRSAESVEKSVASRMARGYRHSDATREKISAKAKGRKRSPEAIAKSAAAMRCYRHSPETLEKMSAAMKGKNVRKVYVSPEDIAERIVVYRSSWRSKNPEKVKAYVAKWRSKNREKIKAYDARRYIALKALHQSSTQGLTKNEI